MEFEQIENKIIDTLERTMVCTLATANSDGAVSASQMSLVSNGMTVYIQTDKTFEKVQNIKENENVAINCGGGIYFKGKARLVGHPRNNEIFIEKIKRKHPKTYEHYTNLPNEVLIEVSLTECRIWGIDDGKDVKSQETITVVDLVNKKVRTIVCDKM